MFSLVHLNETVLYSYKTELISKKNENNERSLYARIREFPFNCHLIKITANSKKTTVT